MKLMDLVVEVGDEVFTAWFEARLGDLPDVEDYLVGQLTSFLGVVPRAYQYWEANAESLEYPVPEPGRRRLWSHKEHPMTRVYTPEEFVAVCRWHYLWKGGGVAEDSSVLDVAAG